MLFFLKNIFQSSRFLVFFKKLGGPGDFAPALLKIKMK